MIDAKKTVLLVCDIQERFRAAIYNFDSVVNTTRKMVQAAKILEIPVMTTEQNPRALGATVSEVGLGDLPSHLNLGVFPKTKFSMWIDEIAKISQERKIRDAIIVGIESHVCVLQTALQLRHQGITPYVLADGVSSCNKEEIPIALARIRQEGGIVSTSESVLFELVGDASQPFFKPFANLVKTEKATTASSLSSLLGSQQDPAPRSSL